MTFDEYRVWSELPIQRVRFMLHHLRLAGYVVAYSDRLVEDGTVLVVRLWVKPEGEIVEVCLVLADFGPLGPLDFVHAICGKIASARRPTKETA